MKIRTWYPALVTCLLLIPALRALQAQKGPNDKGLARWKLESHDYAAYSIEGMVGIHHLGFFGYDVVQGRALRSEPGHPTLLSLPLVTLLPATRPKAGMKILHTHTYTHFEGYTPVKVAGQVKVVQAIGPLLFLEGKFKLLKVRAGGKDGRFYQITGGKLDFTSQFDTLNGWLKEAVVKYTYTYDTRVPLEGLYTGANLKQQRGVEVQLPHIYSFDGILEKSALQPLIDAWVEEKAEKILEEWAGDDEGKNYALKTAYDSLYVLALLHAKVPKNHSVIQKVVKRIREKPIHSTYSAALLLMVLEAVNTSSEELVNPDAYRDKQPVRNLSDEDRRLVERAVRYLVKGQMAGGWTYVGYNRDKKFFPSQFGPPDNSNTQFALMGLYAALRMGARIDAKVWRKALGHWKRTYLKKGFKPKGASGYLSGWAYEEGRGTAYLSMTAGGLASLSIIAAGLGLKPGDKSRDAAAIRSLRSRGMRWLEYFYSVRQCRRYVLLGPQITSDWAYHLYSIERACDLGRVKTIGHHDWYLEGAMAILNDTYEDMGRDHVYEALCLLFLKRSTPAAITPAVR